MAAVAEGPDSHNSHAHPRESSYDEPVVSDHDLIAGIVDGSQEALAALYDRFSRRVYSLARRICVEEGLAEDVAQEVFIAVWKAPHRFDPDRGTPATWILVMTHHKAVDAVRRESTIKRHTVARDSFEWAADDPSAPSGPGADLAAIDAVVATQVRGALGQLPPDQRRALALAYFGGYTQSEIASLTGAPLGTVKSRIFTGIQRLRSLLEPVLRDADAATTGGTR